MSRIGKQPVQIPSGVNVEITSTPKGSHISVKGPKGQLERTFRPEITFQMESSTVLAKRQNDENVSKSLHGLSRTLLHNMVEGVTKGYEKRLEIQGVGYRAVAKSQKLELNVGFSHPVNFPVPKGILLSIDQEKKNIIIIQGIDKELVGEVAAQIRSIRKPEPYKGKGIRYVGERVRKKAGKAAAAASSGAKGAA